MAALLVATLGVAPAAATVNFDDPSPTTQDFFGFRVALDGNHVLIGANKDDTNGTDVGQAHLFDLSGNLLQTFNDPTPTGTDEFGVSVALDGNHVLIGAFRDDTNGTNVGQAHLFDLNGILLQTFDDPTPTTEDNFGWSVALDGDNVLIGAVFDNTNGTDVGQAHLFDLNGNLLRTFDDPTVTERDAFGGQLALDGNNVLISAVLDDTNGEDVGQAHLFDLSGNLLRTFDDPTPTTEDFFGGPVALDGNNVLIGARKDDTNGTDVGQAHLFDLNGNLLQTFDDPTPTTEDRFGWSVALDGNRVLIGSFKDDTNGTDVGQAYLFDLSGNLLQTFNDPSVTTEDKFGWSVALDGNNVLIGAVLDDTLGTDVGQAHLFTYLPGDFDDDGNVDGLDLGILLGNFNSVAPPSGGELNGTDPVDGLDLGLFLGAWAPAPPPLDAASVPEPTTCTLALAALCLAMSRRRIAVR